MDYTERESAPADYYAEVNSCSHCFNWSQNQIQTEEGDWLCELCAEKYTCADCGVITLECSLMLIDGKPQIVCPDCKHEHKLANPPSVSEMHMKEAERLSKMAFKLIGL